MQCEEKSLLSGNRWYVYLLACADGTYYAGVTVDLERRLRQHNGELVGGARYTLPRRPVHIVWSQAADSRSVAQGIEVALKQLSKLQKEQLVQANHIFVPTASGWQLAER